MVTATLVEFSSKTFTIPLWQIKSASNMARPICIKNTKKLVISTQIVSMEICSLAVVSDKDITVVALQKL